MFLEQVSKENKLYYLVILISSLWFFNRGFVPDISFIVAIAFAVFIIIYDDDTRKKNVENINTGLHYKLNSLLEMENKKPPSYFYIEPDMITFFYDIRDFRIYNRESYVRAIKSVDNMLRIKKELENGYRYVQEPTLSGWQNFGPKPKARIENNIKNYKGLFEMAKTSGQNAINYIHSFSISLPVGIHSQKHKIALEKIHLLVKRVLDDILHTCKKSSSDMMIGQNYGIVKEHKKDTTGFDFILI
jgi:hypothetical protein